MSQAALTKCNVAGCRNLTRNRPARCEIHAKRERQPDTLRGNSAARGYDARWRKLRLVKLGADPLCEDCLEQGITTAAVEVHHKLKVADRPDLRLDLENLLSLCTPHHARRTARGE